jgi:hypothetical protein
VELDPNNEIARGNAAAAIDELRLAEVLIDSETASPDLLAELAYACAQAKSISYARRMSLPTPVLSNPNLQKFAVI